MFDDSYIVSHKNLSNLMSYARYQSDMDDIWAWVSYPSPEEDQVEPHTPETESDCDPIMTLLPTPVSVKDDDEPFEDEEEHIKEYEPFEDEEDPFEEDEQHDEEFGRDPVDSSPYLDSSSLKAVTPLPPSFSRSLGFHAS